MSRYMLAAVVRCLPACSRFPLALHLTLSLTARQPSAVRRTLSTPGDSSIQCCPFAYRSASMSAARAAVDYEAKDAVMDRLPCALEVRFRGSNLQQLPATQSLDDGQPVRSED